MPLVMLLLMGGVITVILRSAGNTEVQKASVPHELFHIPKKCMPQAIKITQGMMLANLPMEQARELEDLTTKCGGWIEKGK